jgi:uncharacterized protein YceK
VKATIPKRRFAYPDVAGELPYFTPFACKGGVADNSRFEKSFDMDRTMRSVLLVLLALCFSGCSSVVEAKYYSKQVRLDSMKKAYVVHDPASTYGCANAAEEALRERGLIVTSGFIQNKPADADFYIEVIDRWSWDVAMFLAALEIRFVDNATGEMIASGTFRQGTFFHTFPDTKQKTFEVIASVYKSQPASK